ncbi:hypothetical protein PUN28_009462 [Cardiocondyla obscurior]|uniref:Uncharacterized protein n=1 Tax=Cardiocondyla obscurior TaxID=286306 RepID=A0AAW2FS45_9HYME
MSGVGINPRTAHCVVSPTPWCVGVASVPCRRRGSPGRCRRRRRPRPGSRRLYTAGSIPRPRTTRSSIHALFSPRAKEIRPGKLAGIKNEDHSDARRSPIKDQLVARSLRDPLTTVAFAIHYSSGSKLRERVRRLPRDII